MRLQQHFGQASEDMRQILISAEKVEKRGTRIREVEFDDEAPSRAGNVIPAPIPRKLQVGEYDVATPVILRRSGASRMTHGRKACILEVTLRPNAGYRMRWSTEACYESA